MVMNLLLNGIRKQQSHLNDSRESGASLVEAGETMKQLADVKYSLDDNVKQNFLEPLHHLQSKDLKEVLVHNNVF